MLSDAARGPFFVGLNVIATTQFALLARVAPQVLLEITKSPGSAPVIAMLVMLNAVVGLKFVSVTGMGALFRPTFTLPKFRDVGVTLAVVPVPLSPTVPLLTI